MILLVLAGVRQRGKRRSPNIRLQRLRINAGYTRRDLARMSGVSVETIRVAERGFVPGPGIQFAISSVFELLPLDVWPLEDQP